MNGSIRWARIQEKRITRKLFKELMNMEGRNKWNEHWWKHIKDRNAQIGLNQYTNTVYSVQTLVHGLLMKKQ